MGSIYGEGKHLSVVCEWSREETVVYVWESSSYAIQCQLVGDYHRINTQKETSVALK